MANENLKKAIKVISDRRQNAKLTAQQHYNQILDEIFRVREIYQQLAQTSIKISSAVFSENDDIKNIINEIKYENLKLQEELVQILLENGYNKNYLDVNYMCDVCDDTGFVSGHKCNCLKAVMVELGIADFNNNMNFTLLTFDKFSLDYYNDQPDLKSGISCKRTMSEIFSFCKQYAQRFHENSPSILMIGETGLGKTHLSLSIANEITKIGHTVMYSSSLDLFRLLQDEFFGRSENKNTMQTILDADLVIIDDLGAEFDSQFNCSSLYNIVNSRLNANKPTIINTNLVPSELERRYTTRIASRLMTLYMCLKFVGKDVRQTRLKER